MELRDLFARRSIQERRESGLGETGGAGLILIGGVAMVAGGLYFKEDALVGTGLLVVFYGLYECRQSLPNFVLYMSFGRAVGKNVLTLALCSYGLLNLGMFWTRTRAIKGNRHVLSLLVQEALVLPCKLRDNGAKILV